MALPFTTRGVVVDLQGRNATLVSPLAYQGSVDHFTVPSGFGTDFASVPRFLQSFIQSTGGWTLAAVLHDWFCVHLAAGDCVVSPRDADGIFRRVLREEKVGLLTRWVMWTGVRWGALFNRHRRPGWWKDAPAVVAITLLGLVVTCAAVWALDTVVHDLIGRL